MKQAVPPKATMIKITALVAEVFGVPVDGLMNKDRRALVARVRQIAMYLCWGGGRRERMVVARHFGVVYLTIFKAQRRVEALMEQDPDLADLIHHLERRIDTELQPGAAAEEVITVCVSSLKRAMSAKAREDPSGFIHDVQRIFAPVAP